MMVKVMVVMSRRRKRRRRSSSNIRMYKLRRRSQVQMHPGRDTFLPNICSWNVFVVGKLEENLKMSANFYLDIRAVGLVPSMR